MRIERLILDGVGCFDHLDIQFRPGRDPKKADIHLLVGPNGSGKSTILMAMAQIFSWLSTGVEKRFRNSSGYVLLELDGGCAAAVSLVGRGSAPFWEAGAGVMLDTLDGPLNYYGMEPTPRALKFYEYLGNRRGYPFSRYRDLTMTFGPFDPQHKETRFSYLAFAYGGQRSVENLGLEGIVEQHDIPLASACVNPKPLDNKKVQPLVQWIANTSAKAAFARDRDDQTGHTRYREAVARIEEVISRITGRGFGFVLSYEPINVSASIDGEELPIDVLPDGLKSLISWIGDLLMRMDRVPWIDETPLLDRDITLFLDEIEVHLHPAWQRKVLPVIQDLLPNAQVFVSTHSPFIIASADDAWIYPLYLDEKGRGHVGETLPSMVGNSYATVLRDVLGIEAEFAPQVDEQLKTFYDLRDKALRREPGALDAFEAKGRELGGFGEEVLAIVRPELRQVERRLTQSVEETAG